MYKVKSDFENTPRKLMQSSNLSSAYQIIIAFFMESFFFKIIGILFIKNDSMEKGIRNFYFLEGLQTNNHMETSVSLVESSKGKGVHIPYSLEGCKPITITVTDGEGVHILCSLEGCKPSTIMVTSEAFLEEYQCVAFT